jgi:hypothetical protein
MNIRITLKELLTTHIILFVMSIIFLEYSKMFRMNLEKHWIYSLGHNWWFTVGFPCAFFGSLILGSYILWKVKKDKLPYFISSIIPFILLIIFIYI